MFVKLVVYILTGIVGLCVGSFLNVVIYRVPLNMSIAKPGSHCTTCGYMLKWYDNIPVISYICLRGRCRKCGEHISFRYTLVEVGNTLLWLACLWQFGYDGWQAIVCSCCAALACSVCLCIAFIDIEHKIIPDRFQIIMLVIAAAFTVADGSRPWWSHLIGAAAAGGVMLLVGWLVSLRVGRDALGGGDIKFAFCAGLFLGWERMILMMLIASAAACCVIVAVTIRANKNVGKEQEIKEEENKEEIKEESYTEEPETQAEAVEVEAVEVEAVEAEEVEAEEIEAEDGADAEEDDQKEYPFGPFLTGGFMIALIFGELLIGTYLGILGLR